MIANPRALAEFRAALGDDALITRDDALIAYHDPFAPGDADTHATQEALSADSVLWTLKH